MTLFSLLLVASVGAYNGPDPARMLLLNGDACEVAVSSKALSTEAADTAKADDDRKKSLADVEKYGPEAVKSAGSSVDLQNAIKAFYSAADAYCKEPSSAGKQQFNGAEKVLDKMLESVGR